MRHVDLKEAERIVVVDCATSVVLDVTMNGVFAELFGFAREIRLWQLKSIELRPSFSVLAQLSSASIWLECPDSSVVKERIAKKIQVGANHVNVDRFRALTNGIWRDTEEVGRALVISDRQSRLPLHSSF